MAVQLKRATIYFEPELHTAARLKSAHTNRTISDIVNDSLRVALREDQDDLDAFEKRAGELGQPVWAVGQVRAGQGIEVRL